MNREIKFRAWDKEEGKMFFPETDNNSDTFWCGFDGKRGLRAVDPYEEDYPLMQFTGLRDKNGREIYEGDILIDDEYPEESVSYGKVGWGNSGWDVEPWFTVAEFHENADNHEIIGNVFENPELLDAIKKQ